MVNMAEIDSKLQELQQWFEENPKLPQEIEPLLLRRFIKCMNGDIEETKKLIELNYTLRNKSSHIFINRDPEDESVKETRVATDLVPLPGLTPEQYKLICFRMVDLDPSKLNSVVESKVFFMITDCRFTMLDADPNESEYDPSDQMAAGDVQIVDIGGYSMGHIARISFLTLRIYMKYLQEAYPVRLKAMHVINCPSYLDRMIAIFKPFIHDEVYKMIHFHTNGLESLYEYVPRDMLPEEYGGKAGKMTDLKEKWTQILSDKRAYLMDPKHWQVEQTQTRSRWSWW